ncbi:alginate O-acetyltransferase AlgX-related protein [Caballeronia sp. S22]|uniref:alginate O-acetyltransferase AlgX-related protein n=1 Tax=Caballeronia sp. S22 TaxID=3137182 RepID=UPI003530F8C4
MRTRNAANLILTTVFIAAISAPLLGLWSADESNSEQRNLAKFPSADLSASGVANFPKDFDAYVNDRFGFRNELLSLHSQLMYRLYHLSGTSQVIAGHGDWLFISDVGSKPDIERRAQFTDAELKDWVESLKQRYSWLASKGVPYRFLVGPDKNTIYPEYLPDRVKGQGMSRVESLEHALGDQPFFIDPTRSLLAHKAAAPFDLYFHTDTHWTQYGAYVGYRSLMKSLDPSRRFSYDDTSFESIPALAATANTGTDMSKMIRVVKTEPRQAPVETLPEECTEHRQALWPLGFSLPDYPRSMFSTHCPGKPGTVLVFRDSYFTSIVPYLSQNYGRVIYAWVIPDSSLLAKMVQQERPSLVIEERVERSMYAVPKPDLPATLASLSDQREFTTYEKNLHLRMNAFLGANVRVETTPEGVRFIDANRVLAKTAARSSANGNVDSVATTSSNITYTGWTALREKKQLAQFIVATSGDQVIYVAPAQNFERRDVAMALDEDWLQRSGFVVEIPREFARSDLRLYAVNGDDASAISMPVNATAKVQ